MENRIRSGHKAGPARRVPLLQNEIHPNALRRNRNQTNANQRANNSNQLEEQANDRGVNLTHRQGVYQASYQKHPQLRNNTNQRNHQNNRNKTNGGGSSYNDRQKGDRNLRIGFKKLEEWSNENPDTIIVKLIGQKMGFEELLDSDLTGDSVVLVVKIMAKLCLSPFKENKTEIMNLVSKEKFIYSLKSYVMQLQLQEKNERKGNKYFWDDVDEFFGNLTVMFESVLETLPTKASEILPKMLKAIAFTIPRFEVQQEVEISSDNKQKFEKLQAKLDLCRTEIERKKKEAVQQQYEDEAPPDDFRQLSVYPTSQEIVTLDRPFIRKHIIEGAYKDVNHYLDVQFRLLKEDFVAPLREGVGEFMHQAQTKRHISKISNIRIYPHVEFLCPWSDKDQVGVLLQFDFHTKKKETTKSYQYSKRFMYGSLVCFTKDNFTSFVFGKIIGRDIELLQRNQVVIGFEPGYDNYELNRPYLMIECSVYFEPYYHVLKALQNMHEESFPMKNYLIDVNQNIEPPDYLNPNSIYDIKNNDVAMFVPDSWPSPENLYLDDTQYPAFKAALTQKFAVIQGPPGTGKTYLGLEVAKTLIRNGKHWYNRTPILVVCFTNHALDQFLEGLINTTTQIVRVGGQSKNPKLEKFTLREKRKIVHAEQGVNDALSNLRIELSDYFNTIRKWNESLDEIANYEGIVEFKHFSNIDPEFVTSWFATASISAIIEWLLGGRTRQAQNKETQEAKLKEIQKTEQDKDVLNRELDMEMQKCLQAENRIEHEIEEDKDLLEMLSTRTSKPTYLLSVLQITLYMKKIQKDIGALKNEIDKKRELERKFFEAQDDLEYLKVRLDEGRNMKVAKKPVGLDLSNPSNMAPDDRWRLYFYWLHQYQASLINQLVAVEIKHRETYKQYTEMKAIENTDVMKQMLLVGMTTTGAARLQTTLQALQSRIVIVEEAAEVLESHIIVSLTNHCEHLILIGDHQQLRPSTANFRMAKHFNLGISLFERMVRNNIQCHVLGVQHRMRPEIAKLIVPNIYPVLENHPSVYNFPPVLGIDPFMYFIDHDHPEKESGDCSKLNTYEAEFLVRLAQYLIQNGYQPEDITILAAYSGQMFALWEERKKYPVLLQDVRITVLDNYQGEESKIILLSLVRNNPDNQIGFLKIENRVCVALSRAKECFYMMGNMDLLCRNSEIWPKVKISLESQECFGKSLTLHCQIHREVTRVTSAKDFDKVPKGGCSRTCGFELNCGHNCTQICHIIDRAHKEIKCEASCTRILCDNNHQCPKMCYEECGTCLIPVKQTLPCGHEHVIECYINPEDYSCQTFVTAELPCGHIVTEKPCYQNTETFKCPFPCDIRVEPCGHGCAFKCHIRDDPDHLQYRCYKPCVKPRMGCSTGEHICPGHCFEECLPCLIVIKKSRTVCSHHFNVACNVNVNLIECPKLCKRQLPCGHQCKKKCYEQCGNCQQVVEKLLPDCGHMVKTKCCKAPSREMCRGQCPRMLSCGHPCKKKCSESCRTQCEELVDHTKSTDCGHKFKISCYLDYKELPSNSHQLLKFCQEPCGTQLACEHFCSGTCGECAQGRIHQICKENCGKYLICGHECPIPCREACQPCNRKCSFRCKHNRCNKKCGETCTGCKENCGRQCKHVKCLAKCGEICTVPPCNEPCQKFLQCGHPCVGFCGDPCPPLCRVCDKEELTRILFVFCSEATEDIEDARFVLLDECKHVLESRGMEQWLKQGLNKNEDEITCKRCPTCKTQLCSTQRYTDYIKKAMKDVITIKEIYFGNIRKNERTRTELLGRLKDLGIGCRNICFYSSGMRRLLEAYKISLSPVHGNKRQPLSKFLAQTYSVKIQVVENLVETFNEAKLKKSNVIQKAVNYVDFIIRFLLKEESRITNQEIADIQVELKRFERIVELCQIEDCVEATITNPNVKTLVEEINSLAFLAKIYTNNADVYLKSKLVDLSKAVEVGIGIRDKEKQEIVKAMEMKQGHWYKCPNGHFYYNANYGGAMEVARCNKCGTAIGGQNHALLPSNRHAGEMDGSRYIA